MALQVPSNYNEFLNGEVPRFVKGILFTCGVNVDQLEDATQDVLLDFIVGEYLRIFDPSKASFDSFMYAFVERRSRKYKSVLTRQRKLLVSLEEKIIDGAKPALLYDLLESPEEIFIEDGDYFPSDVSEQLAVTYQRLKSRQKRHKDYAYMFRLFLGHVITKGRISMPLVCRAMGLSLTTAYRMKAELLSFQEMTDLKEYLIGV